MFRVNRSKRAFAKVTAIARVKRKGLSPHPKLHGVFPLFYDKVKALYIEEQRQGFF